MRFFTVVMASLLALTACLPGASPSLSGAVRSQAQSQSALPAMNARFAESQALPAALLSDLSRSAQQYADEISRRRQLDFFGLHPNPLGLQLQVGEQRAWVLSWLGTSLERTDLNVEVRLLAGATRSLNLNYSGPVTLSRSGETVERQVIAGVDTDFSFELLTGLPGQGVTDSYAEYLSGLAKYLPYRFQARPFEFDDTPLVYAITFQGQLQGYVFMNQRNRLVLGERKYADVQSVLVISPQRRILASYALVAFNPKSSGAQAALAYQIENHKEFGALVMIGATP
ncbi:MAG: hypothetical protein CVV27_01225 [Candidatus Melainabacteria bacterium HGW-Melainabacteria-1]|nr:MAG: hypothetical protein CVV27_01225 [Candidatus Melainabacteria bacterium HGW-Melainabacteria-1]